jgi:uncharacterized protein
MSLRDDARIVETQIGRPLRAPVTVVSRCHLGLPVVVRVPPLLDDGSPFPTLFWLTCPLARTRIGRLEGSGGVRRMENKADADAEFASRLQRANEWYRAERDSTLAPEASPRPSGGVGGATVGVKCLHAHYAHTRAGGDNPVGEAVAVWVEPLDCVVPCVVEGGVNPEWVNRP